MSVDNAIGMAQHGNWKMAAAEATPETIFPFVYNRMTGAGTHLRRERMHSTTHQLAPRGGGGWWRLDTPQRTVQLVRPQDALRVTHIGADPQRRVYDRYTMEGFRPDDADVVVDCGAFIGELSWQVCERHAVKRVVAVEPDPRSRACLRFNTPDRVAVEGVALSDADGEGALNIASDPSESGLRKPDKGRSRQTTVDVCRLDSLVDDVDFLKIEAEGNEPEVIDGMGALRPAKIVVNVSPERDGMSPAQACADRLQRRGYETRRRGESLFAWWVGR